MRHVALRWTAVFSLFCGHSCAPSLVGTLLDEKGEPVASSEGRVNIAPLETEAATDAAAERRPTVVVSIDSRGRFESKDELRPGPYLVEALVPGYGIASRRVMIGEEESVELRLTPIVAPKTKAIGANIGADGARGSGGATLTPPSL